MQFSMGRARNVMWLAQSLSRSESGMDGLTDQIIQALSMWKDICQAIRTALLAIPAVP